jgi:hypothetical protein
MYSPRWHHHFVVFPAGGRGGLAEFIQRIESRYRPVEKRRIRGILSTTETSPTLSPTCGNVGLVFVIVIVI